MTTLYLIKEAMKKNILGCVKILIQKVTCAKFVRYFMKCQVQNLVEIGRHGSIILLSLKIILVKNLIPHDKSESHKDAINSLKNLKIKDALEKIDRITNREKNKANELYVPSNKSP